MSKDNPRRWRQIPRLYGKVQGVGPARWRSHSEAFVQLIGACRDGTCSGRPSRPSPSSVVFTNGVTVSRSTGWSDRFADDPFERSLSVSKLAREPSWLPRLRHP